MTWRSALLGMACISVLTSCSGWYGEGEEAPLPGDRISVLLREERLRIDPSIADLKVTLPPVARNEAWPQHGGSPASGPAGCCGR